MALARDATYLVAGVKPWSRRIFDEVLSGFLGRWHFIGSPEELTADLVTTLHPRYIFFLHWSWRVPEEIVEGYECVGFHIGDLPYGRGGNPLQNLIVQGHQHSKLSALRMVRDIDAGPIYFKEDLCLNGSAEEIYLRASHQAARMIRRIIEDRPVPMPQTGAVVVFNRRTPAESEVPQKASLESLYDFIRMLDAEGYPKAFIIHHGFRYELSRASLYDGRIVADVTITPVDGGRS